MNRRHRALQQRIDAARKKCSVGYGCGNTCITVRKECLVTPRSAIGKQRFKRLLALASETTNSPSASFAEKRQINRLVSDVQTGRGARAWVLNHLRKKQAEARKKEEAIKQAIRIRDAGPALLMGKVPGANPKPAPTLTKEEIAGIKENVATQYGPQIPARRKQLAAIYKARGYHGRPELVKNVDELRGRDDLLQSYGSAQIFYRGVQTKEFADQFKGLGPNGGEHFGGMGIHGDGTYASSGSNNAPEDSRKISIETASTFAGVFFGNNPRETITAFGIKSDARIVDMTYMDEQVETELIAKASKLVGTEVRDIGAAAPILGYQAMLARTFDANAEEYWVVWDRSIVVAARDPQLDA